VVAQEDGTGNLRLLAYLVINQAQAPPVAGELRKLVRAHLPDYMVPAAFLEIAELPFNANGKLDRDALPPPENSKMLLDHDYVPPHTALEERLSAVVAELLRVDRVGIDDNFFLIGGHSLFGTQLIARIRANFGVELPLRSVFESPTPVLLAQKIEELLMTRIDSMDEGQIQRALEQSGSLGGHK
jgi:acyl carrier protein